MCFRGTRYRAVVAVKKNTIVLELKVICLFTGCSKCLGHILTLNVSKTIKEITMHLIYSESLQSQVFYRMFNVNTVSHTPHIKPIVKFLLKCVPALCCLWLQVVTTSVIRP